jgi:hypothetical protein
VAIVQISQITNRKGLQADLPQLAGAELGWSIDERRLFIGNGTLEEGAPVIGNTEILTEFSDILAVDTAYTYKGQAAGYTVQTGPAPGAPITQSLQSWLDQFATVKDFGAVGDGVTDDTEAINRALYQLFCREVNPQIRRSLFFPAGIYRVTETILIPPYATLWGEGSDNSVIRLDNSGDDSSLNAYVARTADSLQQYGVNIGTNNATPPQFITVMNMAFENLDSTTDVFLVQDAVNCTFKNVSFVGPRVQADLTSAAPDTSCIRFASTPSLVCNQIVFDTCRFSGTIYGIETNEQIRGTTIINSELNTLHQGIVLGTGVVVDGGATGVRILSNTFDNIYNEGVIFGNVGLNATGHNIFYDVGNHFNGPTSPASIIIDIQSNNNISIGDLFERDTPFAGTWPRININDTTAITTTNSYRISVGQYVRESGTIDTLINNTSSPTVIFSENSATTQAFAVDYTIIRGTTYRTGRIVVATSSADSTGDLSYTDDYTENGPTGITLTVTESSNFTSLLYTSTNTGLNANFVYSLTYLV